MSVYSYNVAQKTADVDSEASTDTEIPVDTALSEESRRQRDRKRHSGAFTQRTGESDLIFFDGTLPIADGNVLSSHEIEEQVRTAFDNLESKLADRWSKTLDDVMKIEIQLTDPETIDAVDAVYESRFDDVPFPPRTVVGVDALPGGAAVQFDVIAADE